MSRHFEMISSRLRLGGASTQPAATRYAIQQRDLYVPSGSILSPADTPLPRGKFSQTCFDVLALTFGLLFFVATAASLPLWFFIMFFVEVH
jgi:hypothetical protein